MKYKTFITDNPFEKKTIEDFYFNENSEDFNLPRSNKTQFVTFPHKFVEDLQNHVSSRDSGLVDSMMHMYNPSEY